MVSSTVITSGMCRISVIQHEQNGCSTEIRHIPLVMTVLLTILFMLYYRNTTHTTSDDGAPYHSVHVVSGMCRISVIRHEQNGKQYRHHEWYVSYFCNTLLTILFMSYYRNMTHTTSDDGTAYHSVHVVLQKYDTYH
jgi:hypothetical protein